MKIQNITNIEKFFEVVDSCKGKVELVTGEGDRLNLKSKLSQYVSMAKLFLTVRFQSWSCWHMSRKISIS